MHYMVVKRHLLIRLTISSRLSKNLSSNTNHVFQKPEVNRYYGPEGEGDVM